MNKIRLTHSEIFDIERNPAIIRKIADYIEDRPKRSRLQITVDLGRAEHLRTIANKIEQETGYEC